MLMPRRVLVCFSGESCFDYWMGLFGCGEGEEEVEFVLVCADEREDVVGCVG